MTAYWKQRDEWEIPAPVGKVWKVLDDVTEWPQWLAGLATIDAVSPTSKHVVQGARFHTKANTPFFVHGHLEFQDVRPQQCMTFVHGIPGLRLKTTFELIPLSDFSTRVVRTVEPFGSGAAILGLIPGVRPSARDRDGTAERLRKRVKSET